MALIVLCRDKNREKEVLENPVPSGDEEVYLENLEKELKGFSEARARFMSGRDIEPDLFVALGYRDTQADVAYLRRAEPLPMRRRVKDMVIGWIK